MVGFWSREDGEHDAGVHLHFGGWSRRERVGGSLTAAMVFDGDSGVVCFCS